jgi:hypothetical protein
MEYKKFLDFFSARNVKEKNIFLALIFRKETTNCDSSQIKISQ